MLGRIVQTELLELIQEFPVVCLVGPRQVGKTTLAKQLVSGLDKDSIYLDLENPRDVNKLADPILFFETNADKCIIVDEIQNMTDGELNTILTRFGNDTRFILCGDFRQTDLNVKQEKSGFYDIINILKNIKSVKMTDFGIDDIVRSGFVRDYIIEREKYYHDHG